MNKKAGIAKFGIRGKLATAFIFIACVDIISTGICFYSFNSILKKTSEMQALQFSSSAPRGEIEKNNDLVNLQNEINFLKLILAIGLGIVLLTIALIIQTYIQPRIIKRIRKLVEATDLIAQGKLSSRIDVDSGDEIGEMGIAFNRMASSLEEHSLSLEQKIKGSAEELAHNAKQLQLLQTQLITQEKLAFLGVLTAGIAHEIKNPLNFVNNFSYLAEQQIKTIKEIVDKYKDAFLPDDKLAIASLFKKIVENLSTVIDQGNITNVIIQRMLEHSRGEVPKLVLTDINALLDENILLAYHSKRAENPLFNVKIVRNFSPEVNKIPIVGSDISRVFLNLLMNAFYSINQKKQLLGDAYSPSILITTKIVGDMLEIRFHDNGLGIPEQALPKIFTPFYTTKPPGEGVGLGLSLSYDIITQVHKGTILVETKEGEFAEFIVRLPCR